MDSQPEDLDPGHDPSAYGAAVAEDYDDIYAGVFDTDGAVVALRDLAQGGPVLELGVGTGRLAIPLAEHGLDVVGVDGSAQMLDRMRAKPGGQLVRPVVGDFASVDAGRGFALAAITLNTIFALPNQAAQVRCFENVARHLRPGGRFALEAWVPDITPGTGQVLRPRRLATGLVGLVVSEHDAARQILSTTQVVLGGALGLRVFPVVHRYAYPAELDLMAVIAGFELEHRWGGWRRQPFDSASTEHVSVYRLAAGS